MKHHCELCLGLSSRQMDVLGLVARGWHNQEIAAELFIQLRTVEHHITSIFECLDLTPESGNCRVLAVLWWLRDGRCERLKAH